jgi:putative transposase
MERPSKRPIALEIAWDLFSSTEGYYNRQRNHSALGYLTPEQAERKAG